MHVIPASLKTFQLLMCLDTQHSWTVSALHQQLGSWIFAAVKDTS